MDRPEWITRAKPVDAVSVDVGFLIAETFYHGLENGFTQEQWQQLQEPLYQPKIERYGQYVLSAELSESAAELVRYYQDVLRLVARHRKEIDQQSHYFWMRPVIFARGEFAITFPWYDTWEEAGPVLDALAGPGEGLLFHDLEQGWEAHAFADGGRLFMRQGDFDSGEEHLVIAADRARLGGQVPAVRERVGRLVQELSVALGRDYWSRRW
jgi:hypothetical protein